MSLKDLLPEGTYDILLHQTSRTAQSTADQPAPGGSLTVHCPECGRAVAYVPENPFRPFCSQRCKCLDLGAWADERRTLPGTAPVDEDGDSPPGAARRNTAAAP